MGSAATSMAQPYAAGGKVTGPGTGTSDSVPVRLSAGEFVIPADSVKKIGLPTLKALVAATHKHVQPKGSAPVRRMANGGLVGELAEGIRKLVTGGGMGSANPQNLQARQIAGVAPTPAPPAPTPAPAPRDPNNPAGIQFANGGVVPAVRRMANGGVVGDESDGGQQQPTMTYGQQMANVGGAIASGVGRIAKEIFSATPDANSPSGYGLNRLRSAPTTTVAPTPAPALAASVTDIGGRSALDSQAANNPDSSTAIPTLNGASGVTVAGAPGVSKFVTRDGRTLYSNVTGDDNDKLMSGKPGLQIAPSAAVASLSAPASTASTAGSGGGSYIPGVNAPLTQYEQETAARNAGVVSTLGNRGISAREAAREANAMAIARMTTDATLQGHRIAADASRYGVDTQANTAAQRLATEAPEIAARTGEFAAQAKVRQGTAAAQNALLNAKTEDERQAAEDNLRAIMGKDRNFPEQFKTQVVPPRVFPDGTSSPGYVISSNLRTGESPTITRLADQPQTALPPGLVVGAPTKQADGVYSAGGRKVTIKGGKVAAIE